MHLTFSLKAVGLKLKRDLVIKQSKSCGSFVLICSHNILTNGKNFSIKNSCKTNSMPVCLVPHSQSCVKSAKSTGLLCTYLGGGVLHILAIWVCATGKCMVFKSFGLV